MKPLSQGDRHAFENFDKLPDAARLRISVVAALEGVSIPTIWRWVNQGLLPKPTKIAGVSTMGAGEYRFARKFASK